MSETRWRERARRVLARPEPVLLREHPADDPAAPWFFTHGEGCRLWDVDGRPWLDLAMSRGAAVLGYAHPVTEAAFRAHAGCGVQTTLRHPAEVEVAEAIAALMPGAEQVVFAKHGSDACGAAVRLARALTGRDLVLAGGYHGFHDWFAATLPGRGVPAACAEQVETFALDDLDGLERLVRARGAETAAIILEPAHRVVPTAAGLRRVRELANRCGALLIFDEVVTAFRIHLGGVQARYGVVPDLTCLGKAMANGYPLSALAGSREVMAGMRDVYFSMTYQTDSLGFVVARACLHHLAAASVPDRLEETGEAFRAAFDGAARRHGLLARALGFAARLDFDFPAADGLDAAGQRRLFLQSLVEDGLLPSGSILVSEAHRKEDVAIAEESFDRALGRIAAARRTGTAQSAGRVP